jgi:hypothetical protein
MEIVADFRKLLKREPALSYMEVAKIMSARFGLEFTKNGCIGKARRLKMPVKTKVKGPRVKKTPTPKVADPITPILKRRELGMKLTIEELREGDCKFPMAKASDRPPYFYCGQPAPIGSSWCKHHRAVVFGRPIGGDSAKISRPAW